MHTLGGGVLALLTEAPPQRAEDLASLHVAHTHEKVEEMDKSLLNYALLLTNGSATPQSSLVVFNSRAQADIRHPVTLPCPEQLQEALAH